MAITYINHDLKFMPLLGDTGLHRTVTIDSNEGDCTMYGGSTVNDID
jgi:hypothetical protein